MGEGDGVKAQPCDKVCMHEPFHILRQVVGAPHNFLWDKFSLLPPSVSVAWHC